MFKHLWTSANMCVVCDYPRWNQELLPGSGTCNDCNESFWTLDNMDSWKKQTARVLDCKSGKWNLHGIFTRKCTMFVSFFTSWSKVLKFLQLHQELLSIRAVGTVQVKVRMLWKLRQWLCQVFLRWKVLNGKKIWSSFGSNHEVLNSLRQFSKQMQP